MAARSFTSSRGNATSPIAPRRLGDDEISPTLLSSPPPLRVFLITRSDDFAFSLFPSGSRPVRRCREFATGLGGVDSRHTYTRARARERSLSRRRYGFSRLSRTVRAARSRRRTCGRIPREQFNQILLILNPAARGRPANKRKRSETGQPGATGSTRGLQNWRRGGGVRRGRRKRRREWARGSEEEERRKGGREEEAYYREQLGSVWARTYSLIVNLKFYVLRYFPLTVNYSYRSMKLSG